MQTRYLVTGMTCDHCVAHVTEEVSAIPGVAKVDVRLHDGQMIVTSDAAIAFPAIQAAVDEAGNYSVSAA